MNTGLFFGSFNPIHVGHLIIANHIVEYTEVQKVWFVVSPQNPLKKKETLLGEYDRLHLVNLAIEDDTRFKTSSIEFKMPKPSYTIDTLAYLSEKHPKHTFYLIMGTDNLETLHKWKNYEQILEHYKIIAYRRHGHDGGKFSKFPNVIIPDVPLLNISSTFLRDAIKDGKSVRYNIPGKVLDYIIKANLYK